MATLQIENKEQYLMSLEKIDKELHSMKRALHSHIYEPTTFHLFRRMQSYKRHIEQLCDKNAKLIKALREQKEQRLANIESHFQSIVAFRKRVQRYRASLRRR